MQTIETANVVTEAASVEIAPVSNVVTVAPEANKQAAAKRVRKAKQAAPIVEAKPVAKRNPAKPTAEAREAAQRASADASSLARQAAFQAIGAFYASTSKPFKSASDRFADINHTNGKQATQRQAALALCLLTYGAGNIKRDGTFVRGAFNVPSRLVNANAKPGEFVKAQPESGCLGNMLGRVVVYVSGPTSGRDQAQAVYKLDIKAALAEIQRFFGDKQAASARANFEAGLKRADKRDAA